MTDSPAYRPAGLFRLIGSLIYDWLVLLGVLMLMGFLAVAVNKFMTGADAITPGNPLFIIWNTLIIYFYFAGFWVTKAQTIGMRAWRIFLVSTNDRSLGWMHASLRLLGAIPAWGLAGMGIAWRYTNKERLGWQDQASWTHIVYQPKPTKKAK
jgi:uncharacterized RDD family membrane protein YckC